MSISLVNKQTVVHPSHYGEQYGGGLVAKSCSTLLTSWTVDCQIPLSMGFSRQEYWSRFPFPSPGDLPDPGIKPRSPTVQADALTSALPEKPFWAIKGGAV